MSINWLIFNRFCIHEDRKFYLLNGGEVQSKTSHQSRLNVFLINPLEDVKACKKQQKPRSQIFGFVVAFKFSSVFGREDACWRGNIKYRCLLSPFYGLDWDAFHSWELPKWACFTILMNSRFRNWLWMHSMVAFKSQNYPGIIRPNVFRQKRVPCNCTLKPIKANPISSFAEVSCHDWTCLTIKNESQGHVFIHHI